MGKCHYLHVTGGQGEAPLPCISHERKEAPVLEVPEHPRPPSSVPPPALGAPLTRLAPLAPHLRQRGCSSPERADSLISRSASAKAFAGGEGGKAAALYFEANRRRRDEIPPVVWFASSKPSRNAGVRREKRGERGRCARPASLGEPRGCLPRPGAQGNGTRE